MSEGLLFSEIYQVSLLTESGGTKDDLRLPTDENLLTQVSLFDSLFLHNSVWFCLVV